MRRVTNTQPELTELLRNRRRFLTYSTAEALTTDVLVCYLMVALNEVCSKALGGERSCIDSGYQQAR